MDKIQSAIEILSRGGIIIFPTDTAFALGCRIDNEKALKRLYKLKRRPPNQAFPILVDSIDMALEYYRKPVNPKTTMLMQKYWPGALTIVDYCEKGKISNLVTGSGITVGIRQPDHPAALKIISEVGMPVLGPSANFHDFPTPYNINDLDRNLVKQVDYVLEGVCFRDKVSTVVDVSDNKIKIIRKGAIEL